MGFLGIKFKSKNQAPRKPHVAADDLVSNSRFRGIYGLCEGEIYGLVDGAKSIRLDGTPIVNSSGQPNFAGVNYEFRTGTIQQEYIKGFASVENEINIGVELRHDRPFVRQINNAELSAVRVRLNFNSLRQQHDNGDITGYAIEYAIDLQVEGGAYQEVLKNTVRGKASSGFKKSHRIDLPKGKRWTLRVRRITPNRNSELIADTTTVDAITEIIDAKLRYPCTALLGLSYDAKTFNNIAKVAVRLKGSIIRVPSNYNPETRTYNGLWDGAFKKAYSNNPAWVFYDVCTHERYGLGNQLAGMVDKWRLYQIGQYCDELVDDGKGGKEPRFTVNVYLQKDEEAYRVLQSLASVFRGMNFWDGQNVIVDSDTPKDAVYTFTPANVVGGEFNYSGTRARDRHNIAKVAWDNPDNDFKTEYEFVKDEAGIAKYGIHQLELNAFGCTSQGQAQRAGLWALKSEQLETRSVTFKTGLQGFIPQVGQVINIADNVFAGRAISGRIVAINGKQITLDRPAGKVGDTFTANHDGIKTAKIVLVKNSTITLDKSLDLAISDVWAIISDDLKLMQFKVLAVKQNDDNVFEINALQHEPQKYQAIDSGANITQATLSVLQATLIEPPSSVTLTSQNRTHQGQNMTTLTIAWAQVVGAVAYLVQWRKDDGNWQTLPPVPGQSVDIDGVYQGRYLAQVIAIDAFDNQSLAAISPLTPINGKQGRPPKPTTINASGGLFSMVISWTHAKGSEDANYTEIQVSPDGRSNIATLGQFAYPTNKHEITGLQGNLTQFYRARIVDKLGNQSDWTAWVSGTTDARADKVLDIISGQIRDSHLDQTLRTPIGKIGTIESTVNGISGKIPNLESGVAGLNTNLGGLNGQLTTVKNDLTAAKKTLQTAAANITTERNRISTAIRDIATLQNANNAKTTELANLTNTVNGHTSDIRELSVTTGDLSQKYTALKTATDAANSEITAIKQTQAGQATQLNTIKTIADKAAADLRTTKQTLANADTALGQRISAIDTAYKSADSQTTAKLGQLEQSISNKDRAMAQRVDTLNANYTALDNRTKWTDLTTATDLNTLTETGKYFIRAGSNPNAPFAQWAYVVVEKARNDRITQTAWADNNASLVYTRVYNGAWRDWEKTATGKELDTKATTASLNEFKQAQATKDTATTQKLSQLESGLGTKANATALNNYYTKAQTDQAIGGRVERFEASLKRQEINAVTDLNTLTTQGQYFIKAGNNPNAPATNWLFVDVETSNDQWIIMQTVRQDNNAKNQWVRQRYNGNWSAWEKVATGGELNDKASASALNELNTRVTQVDGKITAEANKVSQLQTTLNGQTTSIRNVEQSVNGVKAVKAVTVDNNGFISGYGLMSELQNGRVTSRFGINADQIYFGATTTAKKPFVFTTRTTTIDGVSYPAGAWLNSASIANASIKLAHIDKASIGNLSALSANIGHFKSAERGARLEIKDTVLLVYDANNTLRVRLGLW